MDEKVVLILHGWGGNKPEHWQEHLYSKLTGENIPVYYPLMPNPSSPEPNAWTDAVRRELGAINRHHPECLLTVVAHSLGSITWMHLVGGLAAAPERIADRVMLVAPPYIMQCAPPPDAPHSVSHFFPPPIYPAAIHAAARETILVCSNNDDYATHDQTQGYGAALQIPVHLLEGAGHISPYYGYGRWTWVEDWCMGTADLPPLPKR